jgi:hypothetical protein
MSPHVVRELSIAGSVPSSSFDFHHGLLGVVGQTAFRSVAVLPRLSGVAVRVATFDVTLAAQDCQ